MPEQLGLAIVRPHGFCNEAAHYGFEQGLELRSLSLSFGLGVVFRECKVCGMEPRSPSRSLPIDLST